MDFIRRSTACLFSCLLAGPLCSDNLHGQEPPVVSGVQVLSISSSDEGELSGDVQQKLAEGAVSMFSSSGAGFSFSSSPMGGVDPNSGSQLFHLLSNESVRNELQLTEEQYAGTKHIMQETGKKTGEYIRNLMAERKTQGGTIRLDGAAFKELQAEAQLQAETAIEEILLPKQLDRIRQLAYQIEIAQSGLGEALVSGRLGTDFDVHEDQKQHITDRAAVIEAEARAAIAKIRTAARAKLLAELTPDQRKAAEGLLGEYFDYEEPTLEQRMRKQLKDLRSTQPNKSDGK